MSDYTTSYSIARTFTLTLKEIQKLDELERTMETNKSELVRKAIDLLAEYVAEHGELPEPVEEGTAK